MKKLSALTLSIFALSAIPTEFSEVHAAPHKNHFKKRCAKAPVKKAFRKNKKQRTVLCSDLKSSSKGGSNSKGGAYESVPVQVKPMETSGKDMTGHSNHTGLYIGFGLSGKRLTGDYNLVTPNQGINRGGISTFGFGTDIHFGYMHQFDSWGMGAEAYFDPIGIVSKDELRLNNQAQEYRIRMSNTYGLALKVGYHVSPSTMIFGRFGAEQVKMQLRFTDTGTMTPINNASKNKIGMTFGLGLRETFAGNWAFGMEYFYSLYGSQTFTSGTTTSRIRPGGHTVRFTISYLI